jgi:serine/threonine protein kinase
VHKIPTLTGYKINHEIGAGGMARVFDATQISLNRPVAIKFLSSELYAHSEARELFEKESLIIAQLNHPNIVHVIDKGLSEESMPYFVMEKIEGIDLDEMIGGAQIPFEKKMDITIQSCKGLDYAHKSGIIHRDIKPANIIISQHGVAKILDFGIALAEENSDSTSKDSSQSNQQTSIVGSQGFIAPEQLNDYAKATVVSDVFSFGILMQRLFCSVAASPDYQEDKSKLRSEQFKKLPKQLQKIIIQCVDPEPTLRYQSLTEVRNKLLEISQGSHITKRKLEQASEDTKDLSDQFKLLDILANTQHRRVYLFQKKSNSQLLVIKKRRKQDANIKISKLVSSLRHPNIARIYATAISGEHNIVVSEYLSGGSLSSRLISPMPLDLVLDLSTQICSGLTFAHNNKFLHTRLSPSNLLFANDRIIKLTDFSLDNKNQSTCDELNDYLPPGKQAVSERYDLYSLGAIMYHMLYGARVNMKKLPRKEKIHFRLERLIDSLIAIDPINRPENSQEVLSTLKKLNRKDKKLRKASGLNSEEIELGDKQNNKNKKKKNKKGSNKTTSGDKSQQKWLISALVISTVIILLLTIKIIF